MAVKERKAIFITKGLVTLRSDMKKATEKLKAYGLDPLKIDVSIQTNMNLAGWLGITEPDDFINKYFITIELFTDEGINEKKVIGHSVCYFISGYSWANEEACVDLRDIAEAMSGDLLTAVIPVTDHDGELLDDFLGLGHGILYIEHFYIIPEYRCKGVGKIVLPLIINILGREAGVITAMPCPTEDDGKTRIDKNDPRFIDILNNLCKFLMSFGFYRIDKENMVWVKNTSLKD